MRPAEQKAVITDKSVALSKDGVHDVVRNAATAKFLFEVFANDFGGTIIAASPRRDGVTLFASPVSGAAHGVAGRTDTVCDDDESKHGSNMPLPDDKITSIINIADSIGELFAEFRKLGPCESVISYWQVKFKEPIQPALDSCVFYSQALDKKISVIMPIQNVVAAIATLLLDNDNLYFKEAKDRSHRIKKLFSNMHSVSISNICHTGQRDALLSTIDGVEFYCGHTKRSYRFPESIPAYMSSLQHTYIERYLHEKKQSDFSQYSQLMLTWCKAGLPDDEVSQLADYLTTCDGEINEALMSVGLCPSDSQIDTLKRQYFSDHLQYINPILGEDTYWHCVQEIRHMLEGSDTSRNCYLSKLNIAIINAIKPSEVKLLEPKLKTLLMIESSQRNIKRYRLALQYHLNEEGVSIIDAAQQAIADYYAIGSPTASLEDKAIRDLQALNQAVSTFKSQGWVHEFENFFTHLFPNSNIRHLNTLQAKKLDSKYITDMTVDDAWLDHHFPTTGVETAVEFTVYTANYFLIYLLTHSHKDWPERAPDVLTDLIKYFNEKLGVNEETEQERQQHQALKESSYNAEFLRFLHALSDIATGRTQPNDPEKQRNIYSASIAALICNFHASLEMLWPYLDEEHQYKIKYGGEYSRIRLHPYKDAALLNTTKLGYQKASQQLLSLHANPIQQNSLEWNLITDALFNAVTYNRIDTVKAFLDAPNISQELINTTTSNYCLSPDHLNKVTILHIAAKCGLVDMIKLLLGYTKVDITAEAEYSGPSVDAPSPTSALAIAVMYGSIETVMALLSDDRIQVSIDDLRAATRHGNIEIFKLLLKKAEGQHPFSRAFTSACYNLTTMAIKHSHNEILKYILEYDRERAQKARYIGHWDYRKHSFLELNYAVEQHDIELVKLILEYKDNVFSRAFEQPELFGFAFVHAIKKGYTGIVKILIEKNCCYKKRNLLDWGELPRFWGPLKYHSSSLLHVAAEYGRTEVVKLLLADDTYNVTYQDPDGRTALHCAAYYDQPEVAKLLVKDGRINTGARARENSTGETAHEIALKRNHMRVAFTISPIRSVCSCTIS